MKMTFRWYGENSDSVTLTQIRQIPGMTGIMGFLDYKAAGEVWTQEEISRYLHGEEMPCMLRGWCAVSVDGFPVGLGKAVGGVLKNHYPKGLRR